MKKTIFRLFIVVNLILVFVGCKTQQVTPTNKALYHKSLENLDAKNFVIKINFLMLIHLYWEILRIL